MYPTFLAMVVKYKTKVWPISTSYPSPKVVGLKSEHVTQVGPIKGLPWDGYTVTR